LFDRITLSSFALSAGNNLNSFRREGVAPPLRLFLLESLSHTIVFRSTVIVVVLELLSLLRSPVVNEMLAINVSVPLLEALTKQAQTTTNRHAQGTTKSVFIFGFSQ
jgi:hypothetical protein